VLLADGRVLTGLMIEKDGKVEIDPVATTKWTACFTNHKDFNASFGNHSMELAY
jgi:hypothetical protein